MQLIEISAEKVKPFEISSAFSICTFFFFHFLKISRWKLEHFKITNNFLAPTDVFPFSVTEVVWEGDAAENNNTEKNAAANGVENR